MIGIVLSANKTEEDSGQGMRMGFKGLTARVIPRTKNQGFMSSHSILERDLKSPSSDLIKDAAEG